MKSKRSSYRFRCSGETVHYKTALSEGEAELVDISTDGCALLNVTCPVSVGERVLILISLPEDNSVLEMQAEVLRQEESGLGFRFTLIEEETRLKLRNHFARKIRAGKTYNEGA